MYKFILALMVLSFSCSLASAQCSLPLYDDFGDGDDVGWTRICYDPEYGCTWNIVDGAYILFGSSTIAVSKLDAAETCCDYVLEADVRNDSGNDKHILGRYFDNRHNYEMNLRSSDNTLWVQRKNGAVDETLGTASAPNEQGQWYHLKMVLEGPRIMCYVDGELMLDIIDPNPVLCGPPALWGHPSQVTMFDNVSVEELDPVPAEHVSWGTVKASYSVH